MRKFFTLLNFISILFLSAQNANLINTIWNVSAFNINGQVTNKPSIFYGSNSSFSRSSIDVNYFDSNHGEVQYINSDQYRLLGLGTTLTDSFYQEVNDFDYLQSDVFYRQLAVTNPSNLFSYEIINDQLIITNSAGNKGYYNKVGQKGLKLINDTWNITNLKVSNVNYTPTLANRKAKFNNIDNSVGYFNLLTSTIFYDDVQSKFSLSDVKVTIADSFDPAVAEFDGKYLEKFFGIRVPGNPQYIAPNNPFSYSVSADGNTLTITNSKGDVATYSKEVLATNESKKLDFKIYPNPVKNELNIANLQGFSGKLTVKIFDVNGKLVLTKQFGNTEKASLNLNQITKGNYLISIESNNKTLNEKFIKE
jgi:hypothetical protein